MKNKDGNDVCGVCASLLVTYGGTDIQCDDCGYPDELWGGGVSTWWELETWFEGWEHTDTEILPVDPNDLIEGLLYIGIGSSKICQRCLPKLVTVKEGKFYQVADDDEYVLLEEQGSIMFVMAFIPPKYSDDE